MKFVVAYLNTHEVLAVCTMDEGRSCGMKTETIATANLVCRMRDRALQNILRDISERPLRSSNTICDQARGSRSNSLTMHTWPCSRIRKPAITLDQLGGENTVYSYRRRDAPVHFPRRSENAVVHGMA